MLHPLMFVAVVLLLQTPAPVPAVVHGHVVRSGTTTAVPYARIVAARIEGTIADYRTVVADAAGAFAFADLTPGRYRIYAVQDGYFQTEYGQRPVAPTGIPVVVGAGGTSPDLVIAMLLPGVITGRVTENGAPLRQATVRAIRITYRDGRRQLQSAAITVTDDRGDYRLFGLQPGSYIVSALAAPRPRIEGNEIVLPTLATVANGNRRELRMPLSVEALDPAALEAGVDVPTYYPGTTNVSLAGLVDVRGGVTAYGIDLSAARSSAFRVSGLITLDPAISATSLSVRLQPQVPGAPAPPMVPTGPGPFTLTGVAPGAYALLVQTTDAGAPVTKTLPVEVIDQDVKGLEIVLRQGVPVRGRLKIDGEADSEPGPAALVQLLVVGQGGPGYSAVRVAADGSYTVPNVRPGDYRFRVIRGGQAFWIKSARFGGQDLRSGLLSVDADFPERELDIVISTRTATLDARVIDEARQPVSGAMVILVPDASRRNLSELFVSGTADGEGRVHLSGLTPGDYRVFASIAIEAAGWQDPNVLRPRETRGAALRLMEGETKPLTLGLTP